MFPPAVVDGSAVNARARAAPLVAQHDELLPWNELPGGGSVHAEHSKQLAADVRIVEGAVAWRLDRHVAIALLLLRRDQLTSDENAVEQSLARGVIEQRAGRLSCEAGKGKRWDRRRGIAPRGKRCCEGHGPHFRRRRCRRFPSRRRAFGSVRSADSDEGVRRIDPTCDVLVRFRTHARMPFARRHELKAANPRALWARQVNRTPSVVVKPYFVIRRPGGPPPSHLRNHTPGRSSDGFYEAELYPRHP
jgi:hypothetical protein